MTRLTLGLIVALLGLAPAARAHEYWLAPSAYRAGAGDTLAVRAFVGTGFRGELKPYAPSRVVRFELRAARRLDLSRSGVNGGLEFARFVLPDGDGTLIGYQSNFVSIELPAAEFDRYLALEGLDAPRAARAAQGAAAGPGRERYARNCKTWIAGGSAERAGAVFGHALEIVPVGDPDAGARLTVRVLFRGKPLAGALLRAWHQPLASGAIALDAATRDSVGAAADARTDRDGLATLDVAAPGEWLIGTVHMVACTDRAAADWESQWASFTFARTGRKP